MIHGMRLRSLAQPTQIAAPRRTGNLLDHAKERLEKMPAVFTWDDWCVNRALACRDIQRLINAGLVVQVPTAPGARTKYSRIHTLTETKQL